VVLVTLLVKGLPALDLMAHSTLIFCQIFMRNIEILV
jgi:hypothetical protein